MGLAQASSHSNFRVPKSSKGAVPTVEAFFKLLLVTQFATIPLINTSHKAIPGSVWVGIAKGHEERRIQLRGYFKNL